jgi:CRISPR-associated protein Cas6/Cse3/CasE subtype I-E
MYKFVTKDIPIQGPNINVHRQEILKYFPFGTPHVRYRVEPGYLIVIYPEMPTVDIKCSMTKISEYAVDTKLKFRIRLVADKKDANKKSRVPIKELSNLVPWFNERAKWNGFKVIDWEKVIPEGPFYCNHQDKPRVYNSVNFEGILVVEDEKLFNHAVTYGFGHQKSWGFGVLDVS